MTDDEILWLENATMPEALDELARLCRQVTAGVEVAIDVASDPGAVETLMASLLPGYDELYEMTSRLRTKAQRLHKERQG